jgi:hypothetical protein
MCSYIDLVCAGAFYWVVGTGRCVVLAGWYVVLAGPRSASLNIISLKGRGEVACVLNTVQPSGHLMYRPVSIHKSYVLPTQSVFVFCRDLRTNSDYSPIQHSLTGFYYRYGVFTARYGNNL